MRVTRSARFPTTFVDFFKMEQHRSDNPGKIRAVKRDVVPEPEPIAVSGLKGGEEGAQKVGNEDSNRQTPARKFKNAVSDRSKKKEDSEEKGHNRETNNREENNEQENTKVEEREKKEKKRQRQQPEEEEKKSKREKKKRDK